MSKLIDKMKSAERERQARLGIGPQDAVEDLQGRIESERNQEEAAEARVGEEKRGLDLARERQAAEVELRRLAHSRAEAEAKA